MLILYFAIAVFFLGERLALAYVDPGTGSLLFQTALTVLLGLGLVMRRVRVTIAGFVRRLAGRGIDSDRPSSRQD